MREGLVRALASALYYTGGLKLLRWLPERYRLEKTRVLGLPWPRLEKRERQSVQLFTYHRVNDDHEPFLPATPTAVFAKQVRYLAKHYTICPPDELGRMLEEDDIPSRAVMITFDDGYRDVFLNAFPILRAHDAPAIVFLPSDHIGTDRVLWHDEVARAFRETRRSAVRLLGDDAGEQGLGTIEERVAAFRQTVAFLRTLDPDERARRIAQLHDDLEVPRRSKEPELMMTWEEVRVMSEGGIAFGSHTVTHPILASMPPEEADREIAESKSRIEAYLGRPVRLLAYPNGRETDFTEANKRAAQQAGYDGALTTIFGVNRAGQDRFELRRGGPWEEHLPTFALKLVWYRLTL